MTQLIFDKDEELAVWAEINYPECSPIPRPFTSIGVADNNGNILAVAIFHDFAIVDIHVTFIAATRSRWATKPIIKSLLHYPFLQLGVKRMTAITNKSNKKARKLLESLGFKLEGVHPLADAGLRSKTSYGLYEDRAMEWFNG